MLTGSPANTDYDLLLRGLCQIRGWKLEVILKHPYLFLPHPNCPLVFHVTVFWPAPPCPLSLLQPAILSLLQGYSSFLPSLPAS